MRADSGVDIPDKTGLKALNIQQVEVWVGDNRVIGKNSIVAKINEKKNHLSDFVVYMDTDLKHIHWS